MGVIRAANERDEAAELLGEREEHLVLVVDGLGQEGDELGSGSFHAEGEGNRREFFYRVEAELLEETVVLR